MPPEENPDPEEKSQPKDESKFKFPAVINASTVDPKNIKLPLPIIHGVVSRSEKMELAGGSKTYKTWNFIDLALAVSNGTPWFGRKTEENHVVYLNLELQQPFFEQRLVDVAKARQIDHKTNNLHILHLRGVPLWNPECWRQFVEYLMTLLHTFPNPFLLSDPIYKMLGGRNENAANEVCEMMNQLEDMIQQTQGASLFGHHFSKGNQSDKEAIDRPSGSGVFQRDPDTILTQTDHKEPFCYTVNSILRNHPPIEDFVVEWKHPLFDRRYDLDPQDIKPKAKHGPKSKYTVADLVTWLGDQSLRAVDFQQLMKEETGMSSSVFYNLLKEAEKAKLVFLEPIEKKWQKR